MHTFRYLFRLDVVLLTLCNSKFQYWKFINLVFVSHYIKLLQKQVWLSQSSTTFALVVSTQLRSPYSDLWVEEILLPWVCPANPSEYAPCPSLSISTWRFPSPVRYNTVLHPPEEVKGWLQRRNINGDWPGSQKIWLLFLRYVFLIILFLYLIFY